jgi:Leucine-rich repeat (LRR) protein
MQNLINKINEFSNFLLNNNVIEEQKLFINGFFIDSPYYTRVNFIRTLRLEDENENKSVIELDISNNYIREINSLTNLKKLKKLNLEDNRIRKLGALLDLPYIDIADYEDTFQDI